MNATRHIFYLAAVISICAIAIANAHAAGGILQINQACATSTNGCFPGDSSGFPVTITRTTADETGARYFRLTSDIQPRGRAIQIEIDDVTLDLGGFVIDASSSPGNGDGVGIVGGSVREGITVRNGVIRSTGGNGVELGKYSRVEHLTITGTGSHSIVVAQGSVVTDNLVTESGNDGIVAGPGSRIATNVVFDSDNAGIVAGEGSAIIGNTLRSNGQEALQLEAGSGYQANVMTDNNRGDGQSQVDGGTDLGGNICGTDTTCP